LVDETAAVIASIIVGIAGGFLSSWMAFNASGEEFDKRKHGNALITGAVAGALAGAVIPTALPNMTSAAFIIYLVLLFGATIGVDRVRSSGSQMVVNRKSKTTSTSTTTTAGSPSG